MSAAGTGPTCWSRASGRGDEQCQALQQVANARHLTMSTMARAWLLDRLEKQTAS
jgi:hypothetical protein